MTPDIELYKVVVGSIPTPAFFFVRIRRLHGYKWEFGGFKVENPVLFENDVPVSPVLS